MSKKDNAAAVVAEATVAKKAEETGGRYMYIGPNRLKNGLRTNQVFKGLPKVLIEATKAEYPHIERLFVKVEALSASLDDLKKKGTPINLAFLEMTEV